MNRDKNIDNLRGLAILAIIIIHATSYFLKDKIAFFIWDSLQWAVPVFLFCSFYLYYSKVKEFDKKTVIPYLKKRFNRLIIPYYIFLLAYFPLIYFFEAHKFNLSYIVSNIFLYGGLNLNWVPLLFVYFSFLMPLLLILKKKKACFNVWGFLAIVSSIVFIFYSPFNYRATMWLPWSLLAFFTIFFIKIERNWKVLFSYGLAFLATFILVKFIEIKIGHNLTHYGNKYPPTLFHLSYGIVSTIILFWLSKKNIFTFLNFDKLLYFLSVNSYKLFFIHLLVIFILIWTKFHFANWFTFFLVIFGLSSAIVWLLKASQNVFLWLRNRS
jgi:peptidoglycan/LPS O-acetylase OafA/YrhL